MDTYTFDDDDFSAALARVVNEVPLSKLGVGLCTAHGCGRAASGALTHAQLQLRFDAAASAGVRFLGIWDAPVPNAWWPFIQDFNGA